LVAIGGTRHVGQQRQVETTPAAPNFSSPARRTFDGINYEKSLGSVWEAVNRAFLCRLVPAGAPAALVPSQSHRGLAPFVSSLEPLKIPVSAVRFRPRPPYFAPCSGCPSPRTLPCAGIEPESCGSMMRAILALTPSGPPAAFATASLPSQPVPGHHILRRFAV